MRPNTIEEPEPNRLLMVQFALAILALGGLWYVVGFYAGWSVLSGGLAVKQILRWRLQSAALAGRRIARLSTSFVILLGAGSLAASTFDIVTMRTADISLPIASAVVGMILTFGGLRVSRDLTERGSQTRRPGTR
jgi:hypothetical protein